MFGMAGTADERASKSAKYYTRGDYIPGLWVDGECCVRTPLKHWRLLPHAWELLSSLRLNSTYTREWRIAGMDVLAVKHATKFAKEYVLKHGPIVLEMDTYRQARTRSTGPTLHMLFSSEQVGSVSCRIPCKSPVEHRV